MSLWPDAVLVLGWSPLAVAGTACLTAMVAAVLALAWRVFRS